MPAAPPVSFLVSRFPNPSETFIQAQVEGLIARGASVEVVTLAQGDANALAALKAKLGEALSVRCVPVPKTLLARIAAAPAALAGPHALAALDPWRFGDDAASLRLLIAAARWPRQPTQPRVWLAHYGRWGRFACALRDLGLIAGPIATVFHGKDMSAYLKKRKPGAYLPLFARGDLFLPISDYWREKLIALGAPPQQTLVHRMGVDVSRFSEIARTRKPDEPVRLIGVGRFVEKKGFDDALRAFAGFRAEIGAPDATLTLIGDGEMRDYLEGFATSLNLGGVVRFTGLLPHARVAEELANAHIFVLPSKTAGSGDMEGIPVALMEAMAQGLPVLATRHSGTPELVEQNVSGLLCNEGDWRDLALNMRRLADAPERWAAMGAAGAAKVRGEFDLGVWNDRLLERLSALWAAVTSAPPHANTAP
jgi:colanic acid/amylovoran biosynthesis glycosyltransferase